MDRNIRNRSIVKVDVVEIIINDLRNWAKTKIATSGRTHLHAVVLVEIEGECVVIFDGPMVGEIEGYKGNYAENAMKKALLSARTGMDTKDVVENCPTLLLEGDILFGGGVYSFAVSAGVSGSTERDDHEVATRIIIGIDDHYTDIVAKMREDALAKKGPVTVPVTDDTVTA